jgi:hypothetical protein
MSVRVQVILDEQQRVLFQCQATSEGLSLSGWLRKAGEEKLAKSRTADSIRSVEELRAFFQACDTREQGKEPDWEQHLEVIQSSRGSGTSGT